MIDRALRDRTVPDEVGAMKPRVIVTAPIQVGKGRAAKVKYGLKDPTRDVTTAPWELAVREY